VGGGRSSWGASRLPPDLGVWRRERDGFGPRQHEERQEEEALRFRCKACHFVVLFFPTPPPNSGWMLTRGPQKRKREHPARLLRHLPGGRLLEFCFLSDFRLTGGRPTSRVGNQSELSHHGPLDERRITADMERESAPLPRRGGHRPKVGVVHKKWPGVWFPNRACTARTKMSDNVRFQFPE